MEPGTVHNQNDVVLTSGTVAVAEPSTGPRSVREMGIAAECDRAGITSSTWCASVLLGYFGSRPGWCPGKLDRSRGVARVLPMVSEDCSVRHLIEHLVCRFLGNGSPSLGSGRRVWAPVLGWTRGLGSDFCSFNFFFLFF